MNLLILEGDESGTIIGRNDRRYEHVKKVLKKHTGDEVEAGLATDSPFGPAPGSIGIAHIDSLEEGGMKLVYRPVREADPLPPLRLILGFPRPIQANRIFKDLTSLGLAELILTGTELGEKSYLESDFFRARDYRRPLLEGAEQAANPRIARVSQHWSLGQCLDSLDSANADSMGPYEPSWDEGRHIVLHPDSSARPLSIALARPEESAIPIMHPVTMAIGSERGWTERELEMLRDHGFELCSLGSRILKTETACAAAIALALASMALL